MLASHPQLLAGSTVLALLLATAPFAQVRKLNGLLAPLPDEEGAARILDSKFSADGARVVYRADPLADGSTSLYAAPTDGGPAVRLALFVGTSFELSPDGSRVAFASFSGGVRVVPSDGSGPATSVPAWGRFRFTPDGTRLVSIGNDLRVTPLDGGAPLVLDARCCGLYTLELSPDGTQVLYVSRQGPPGGISQALWHARVDGSSAPRLISPELGILDYEFTPDGAYALYRDAYYSGALYAVRLDQEPAPILLAPGVRSFAVSHDSTRVVFTLPLVGSGLFSVPIEGGPALALGGPLVAGGNVEGFVGEPGFAISSDDRHVVYRADQEVDGRYSLYSVPLHGGGATRRIERSGVERFGLSSDGERVVFAARDSAAEPLQLFSARIRLPLQRSAAILSSPAVPLGAPMPAGGGLVDFALRSDALGVVYSARQESAAVELYLAPIAGESLPVRLNAPLVEGGNVAGLIVPAFQVDPTSRRVLYRADQDFDEAHELFLVPLDGSELPRRVHGPPERPPTAGAVRGFALAGDDGRDVLFRADAERARVIELQRVSLDGGADERINLPLAPGAEVTSAIEISRDGRWVVYKTLTPGRGYDLWSYDLVARGEPVLLAFEDGYPGISSAVTADSQRVVFEGRDSEGARELRSRVLDGSAPAVLLATVQAASATAAFRLTPDGRRVVYQGVDPVTWKVALFSAPVDGSAPPVRVSGTPRSRADVVVTDFGLEAFQLSADSRWVVFLADRDVNERYELYRAPVDGSAEPLRISARIVPGGGDVSRFALSPSRAVYLADGEINGRNELYSVPLLPAPRARSTTGPAQIGPVRLNGRAVQGGVTSFRIAPGGEHVAFVAIYEGETAAATYGAPIDGHASARRLCAFGSNWRFTPDGRRLLLCAAQDSSAVELYSALLDGSEPVVRLNAPLLAGANVVGTTPDPYGESTLQLSPDGGTVVYMADQRQRGRYEIFAVPVDGSRAPLVVNGPLATGRDVGGSSWGVPYRVSGDGSEVVYLADHDENDVVELYAAPMP